MSILRVVIQVLLLTTKLGKFCFYNHNAHKLDLVIMDSTNPQFVFSSKERICQSEILTWVTDSSWHFLSEIYELGFDFLQITSHGKKFLRHTSGTRYNRYRGRCRIRFFFLIGTTSYPVGWKATHFRKI